VDYIGYNNHHYTFGQHYKMGDFGHSHGLLFFLFVRPFHSDVTTGRKDCRNFRFMRTLKTSHSFKVQIFNDSTK